MICSKCGFNNENAAAFCVACGQPLSLSADEQTPVQSQYTQGAEQPPYNQQSYEQSAQQPYGQQPQYPYQRPYQQTHPGDSAATASLVCGIIGLFCFGFVLGIIAIVQGTKAKQLGYPGGKATAGVVLGIIGLVLWGLIIISNIF